MLDTIIAILKGRLPESINGKLPVQASSAPVYSTGVIGLVSDLAAGRYGRRTEEYT